MNHLNSSRTAAWVLASILSLFVLFHLLVLLGLVPFAIVWGGKLHEPNRVYVLESVSMVVNLLMLGTVGLHAGLFPVKVNHYLLKSLLWSMVVLFLLNTIGNGLSEIPVERLLFTPLTLLLAAASLRLALGQKVPMTDLDKTQNPSEQVLDG